MKDIFKILTKPFVSGKTLKKYESLTISEKFFGLFLVFLMLIGIIGILLSASNKALVEIPARGGSFSEGVIGKPRFINPLLAQSDVDRDITSLVYSGLLRIDENGNVIEDLAERYEVSEDGTTYTVTLKDGARFHDGTIVTADDVIFTIEKAQDPVLKSPKRSVWYDVGVTKIDNRTVEFKLSQPYVPFVYNLTIGILPESIWGEVSSEEFTFSNFNTQPVGSGPYKLIEIMTDDSGVPEKYILESFKDFVLGEPYIERISVSFYKDENELIQALLKGNVEIIHGIKSASANEIKEKGFNVEQFSLPRIFSVFLNQNQLPIFAKHYIRQALSDSIDRQKIIDEILNGYGKAEFSPIPESLLPFDVISDEKVDIESEESEDTEEETSDDTEGSDEETTEDGEVIEKKSPKSPAILVREELIERGWDYNQENGLLELEDDGSVQRISFTLSVPNNELKEVANGIIDQWKIAGFDVTLQVYDEQDFKRYVVRPREYDSILFGQIMLRGLDLYAYWHSSQREDPGNNISLYSNIDANKYLEEIRTEFDEEARGELFRKFLNEIEKDSPAIFLYSPDFIYVVPEKIEYYIPSGLASAEERFSMIHKWHIKNDYVWPIFSN